MNQSLPLKQTLPVSVIVCAYNEEKDIKECLEAIRLNHPAEIWVIDGGSSDLTVQRAAQCQAIVKIAPQRGLVYQRALGLSLVTQPYVAFVDADDVLDPDCLELLLADLNGKGYAAVQAQSRSYSLNSYCEKAVDALAQLKVRQPGPTRMLGRPVLHVTEILKEISFDLNWGRSYNEDTDLSIRHELKGLTMGIGRGRARRKQPKSLGAWLKKWKNYGRGDAQIIRKHPFKKWSILHHQLINYPILISWEALRLGKGQYVPFYILFGLVRFTFMLEEFFAKHHPYPAETKPLEPMRTSSETCSLNSRKL